MLLAIMSLVRRWQKFDESVRELSRLSGRQLADIGIKRGDIPHHAWKAAMR